MVPALSAAAPAAKPVRRLGFVYVPNGVIMQNWTPAATGQGLRAHADSEAARAVSRSGAGAERPVATTTLRRQSRAFPAPSWLTGVGAEEVASPTSTAASRSIRSRREQLGQETQLASLELGARAARFRRRVRRRLQLRLHEHDRRGATPTTPLPMETDPRVVFERLFGDGDTTERRERGPSQLEQDRSILDSVTRDAASLQKALGPGDRRKLDAVSRRDPRRRAAHPEGRGAERRGRCCPRSSGRPGVPERFDEHAKLMFDLQVLAYQTDLTRVITFMMGRRSATAPIRRSACPSRTTPPRTIRTTRRRSRRSRRSTRSTCRCSRITSTSCDRRPTATARCSITR